MISNTSFALHGWQNKNNMQWNSFAAYVHADGEVEFMETELDIDVGVGGLFRFYVKDMESHSKWQNAELNRGKGYIEQRMISVVWWGRRKTDPTYQL